MGCQSSEVATGGANGATILVVDDEREIADLVALYLEAEGFAPQVRYDAETALAAIAQRPFDLAVLDVMLPVVNGFQLCREIRRHHTYPVIMLTAKDAEVDKIAGLNFGADDYLTKPFRPLELVARVKAQLRRRRQYDAGLRAGPMPGDAVSMASRTGASVASVVLSYRGLELNALTHECTVDGDPVQLTPTEFAIARVLLERLGQPVSSEEMFHELWGDETYIKTSNTISVHVRHLREKLGDNVDKPTYIRTVWGIGYKIG
ncbi:response regulator transcription factor [Bifidobacterium eulemuris]|uniref:DNA-binding response regulator n=1 Tax=Bifidobacterium eulemuris TaxID=1765219 RepID=A0A261GCH5_9BIFI|nr:response regulator transcription factor [Bifidobacterium eulemuris]OZG69120.1 DNA-binding response regulator [Bifidobacterium eulemuris]QOL31363.1 response regulator transcription factor [Bifidobacterium eulemuris]